MWQADYFQIFLCLEFKFSQPIENFKVFQALSLWHFLHVGRFLNIHFNICQVYPENGENRLEIYRKSSFSLLKMYRFEHLQSVAVTVAVCACWALTQLHMFNSAAKIHLQNMMSRFIIFFVYVFVVSKSGEERLWLYPLCLLQKARGNWSGTRMERNY